MKLAVKACIHAVSFTCSNTNILSPRIRITVCVHSVSPNIIPKVLLKPENNKNTSYRWYLYFYSHLETPLLPSQENMTTDYFQLDVFVKLVF